MTTKINMSFEKWMKGVDAVTTYACGLSYMDLADNCYRDMFDDGMTFAEAANDTLKNEGFEIG